jgi:hypothetical protein
MRQISKLLGLIITVPILLVAISFAVSNTDIMTLRLWPDWSDRGFCRRGFLAQTSSQR